MDQSLNNAQENPYSPSACDANNAGRKIHWMRRFVWLNAILCALPLLLVISGYLLLALNGVQISGTSGSIGLVSLLLLLCYFLVPNLIMLFFRRRDIRKLKLPAS